jgi:hypothetical protein
MWQDNTLLVTNRLTENIKPAAAKPLVQQQKDDE